jgi:uncharacterized membrane protein YfcA
VNVAAVLLAALVGVTLGLLGGGGAILTVPILVYALGVPVKSAVPMSLLVVGTASAVGAVQRWRARHFNPRHGLWFGLAAVAGALVGARVGLLIPAKVQLTMFAAVTVVAAVRMWRSADAPESIHRRPPAALAFVVACAIGMLTGVIGIGGGFLFVPALVTLLGMAMLEATSLSLMVVTMNAFAGFAGYYGRVAIDWAIAVPFAAMVIVATLAAGPFAAKVRGATLKRIFAVVLVLIGGFVLFENFFGTSL